MCNTCHRNLLRSSERPIGQPTMEYPWYMMETSEGNTDEELFACGGI